MRIFLTGASGHIGSAVTTDLIAAGHEVLGLARNDAGVRKLDALGATPVRGDLDDADGLAEAAAGSDGVIHLAFKHDQLADGGMEAAATADERAVQAMGDALAGSGRPLVATSPIMLLAFAGIDHRRFTEDDVVPGGPRMDTENAAIALAGQGVRSSVVRLPPVVHSADDRSFGFVPTLIAAAREAGASGVLDPTVRWPACATADAARLYRLAVESAPAGTRLHAAAESEVPFTAIAEAIGRGLGVGLEDVDEAEALRRWGFVGRFASRDAPTSSARTRELLGWEPAGVSLVEEIDAGHYFATS